MPGKKKNHSARSVKNFSERNVPLPMNSNSMLSMGEVESAELIHYLETLREQEKQNVARELHDNIGASLTSLALYLDSVYKIFPEESIWLERKHRIQNLMHLLAETTRRMQAQLRPYILDMFGLKAAIVEQIEELVERTEIRAKVSLPDEEVEFSPDRQIVLYRMMQEMLNNVVMNAKPSEVNVILDVDEDQVALTVRDNGSGNHANWDDIKKNYGLSVLREHAKYFGGNMEIFAKPGAGTQMTIKIPNFPETHTG